MKDEIEKLHMRNIMYSKKTYRKRAIQTKIYTKFPSKPTKKNNKEFIRNEHRKEQEIG